MRNPCPIPLTTLEMLDALEAGIAELRGRDEQSATPGYRYGYMTPAAFGTEVERSGIGPEQLARILGVSRQEFDEWFDGRSPVPSWVPAAMRMLALLTPSARHTLIQGVSPRQQTNRSHPFSRIEEL